MASNGETGAFLLAASVCVHGVCVRVCWRDRLLGSEGRERSRQTSEEERSTAGRTRVGAQILSFRDQETV